MIPRNLLLLVVVGLVLAGCGGDADGSPSAPVSVSVVPTSSPSASPSPSPSASVVDRFVVPQRSYSEEQLEAIATVEEFFIYYDRAFEDPTQPFQRLSELTEGEYLLDLTQQLDRMQEAVLVQRGYPVYEVAQVNPVQTIDGETWVRVYVCSDNSELFVANAGSGQRQGGADSPYTVFRLEVRYDGEWRIPVGGTKEAETCEI